MKKLSAFVTAFACVFAAAGCGSSGSAEFSQVDAESQAPAAVPEANAAATPPFPDLQAEILDGRFKETSAPIGSFDFRNFTYPLPRGWQHPDGSDLTLTNGRLEPVSRFIDEDMEDEEKIQARAERRIGMSYVTTRFMDTNGDGTEEAIVILKVETTGAAIPQLVYVYEWKDGAPNLLWHFRTGDRADGGLKDIRSENGLLVVELYGQDRFLLGEVETGKITGDEEQLCCPTYFTRTAYKWNGRDFLMQGKRLTYSVREPSAAPLENYGEVVNAREKSAAKR